MFSCFRQLYQETSTCLLLCVTILYQRTSTVSNSFTKELQLVIVCHDAVSRNISFIFLYLRTSAPLFLCLRLLYQRTSAYLLVFLTKLYHNKKWRICYSDGDFVVKEFKPVCYDGFIVTLPQIPFQLACTKHKESSHHSHPCPRSRDTAVKFLKGQISAPPHQKAFIFGTYPRRYPGGSAFIPWPQILESMPRDGARTSWKSVFQLSYYTKHLWR